MPLCSLRLRIHDECESGEGQESILASAFWEPGKSTTTVPRDGVSQNSSHDVLFPSARTTRSGL